MNLKKLVKVIIAVAGIVAPTAVEKGREKLKKLKAKAAKAE